LLQLLAWDEMDVQRLLLLDHVGFLRSDENPVGTRIVLPIVSHHLVDALLLTRSLVAFSA